MASPQRVAWTHHFTTVAVCAVVVFLDRSAIAAYRDGFDTPSPVWRLVDSDCRARLLAQERTFQPTAVHTGAGAEYVRLWMDQGTSANLTLSIPPARVIQELVPSLWIKASKAGVRLRGRVVLPRSRDPRDGSPVAVWVEGEVYDRPAQWQRLAIRDLPTLVQRQVWIKRGQPQTGQIDEREAYLDLIVINAYTAPGVTDLWIDDLEVEGFTIAGQSAAGGDTGESWGSDESPTGSYIPNPGRIAQQHPPHLEGATLVAGHGPLAVRMIEHRGESFAWLKTLGFNVIRLPQPATEYEFEEARRLDLWLVAPPPSPHSGLNGSQGFPAQDRVAAWDLGSNLGKGELELARSAAAELRAVDPTERPLLVGPREAFWGYRRFADILLLGEPPLGTVQPIAEFRSRMVEQSSQASRAGPVWANVQTAPSAEVRAQLSAMEGAPFEAPLEALQVRMIMLAALEAGATGLCFCSPTPLDAGTPGTQHRAAVLQSLNEELSLIEPWIGGASPRETLDVGGEIRGTAWSGERSKLILLARHFADDQFAAAPAPPQPAAITVSGAPPSWKAYRIGADRLVPVWSSPTGGGTRINVPDVGRWEWIVVTDDPLTMNYLARRLRQNLRTRARLRHEVLSRELALLEQVLAAAPAETTPREGSRELEDVRQAMRQCERLLDAGDFAGSLEIAYRAENLLAQLRRQTWWGAANAFGSRVSSPYCGSFVALPLHWKLTERVRTWNWGGNILPAGDFEDVRRMQSTGWNQDRSIQSGVNATVELSPDRPHQGRYSLRLTAFAAARSADPEASISPLVRIVTAAMPLNAGDVARISGWVRGSSPDDRPVLRIRDSLGGESLADELTLSSEWRPFMLYRTAPQAAPFTVAFELLGPGEVGIDSVTIETLQSFGGAAVSQRIAPRDMIGPGAAR